MLTLTRNLPRGALPRIRVMLGAVLALALIGFGQIAVSAAHAATQTAEAQLNALEFGAIYTGAGAEGVDLIWTGPLQGPLAGRATVRVEYVGTAADRARPVWPVRALLFVSADDATKSFVGELAGTIDWRSGEVQLTGPVIDGWRRGARVEQTLSMHRPWFDGTGTIRLLERTAQR